MSAKDDGKKPQDAPGERRAEEGVTHFPAAARAKACPICGKPTQPAFRPFCSKRCADVDLSRWFNGVYAVPGKSSEEEADGES